MDEREAQPGTPAGALRWASASSQLEDPRAAAEQAATAVQSQLGDSPVDLALVFFSGALAAEGEALAETLRARLSPRCFAAASANAVIAAEHEIESGPALTVLR